MKYRMSLAALLLSAASMAVETQNGSYVWEFLSGAPWPQGYQQNTGKPDNLVWAYNEYSPDFFARINNALPEREINEAFLTDDQGSTISLTEEAEVFVTFVHEGAGYRNSFGYFTFDPENPPQTPADVDEIIVFPNLSFPHLTNGHRLSLGTFPAGTHIGFFIAANGYWYDTGVKPFGVPYYYSLQDLNPENDPALRQHLVLLYDEEVSEVILGFEDLPRTWGDNDFNDAVFSVKATPNTAIDSTQLKVVPDVNDSDADGIPDEQDDYPDDYDRAYSTFYPSSADWVTLAYEDNWPKVGDYDMNDLVIRERFETIYNAQNEITGFKIHGYIDARGAAHNNGFALRLTDIPASALGEGTLTIDGQVFDKRREPEQSDAVVILWRDTQRFTQTGQTGQCSHFNTIVDCDRKEPVAFELDMAFVESPAALSHPQADFFIFRTANRGHEIHMAGYAPTDVFDTALFGQFDDTSDGNTGRYFKNADNLPWGLKLNNDFRHPREYIDVLWAYPEYEQWVESAGATAQGWYLNTERKHHIF